MRFNDMLFYEKQRFTQPWLWVILISSASLFLFGVVKQIIFGQPFGDNPAPDIILILVLLLVTAITISLAITKLETVIEKDGIRVRFFPFQFSFRHFPWDSIKNSYTRRYNPIVEYGGWGIRGFGKNRAMNVSGNQGLQLVLTDGKRVLIGTRRPEEVSGILRKLGKAGASDQG